MTQRPPVALFLLLAVGTIGPAGAASTTTTVYRCGTAYSQQPCSAAPPLMLDDARSAAQRAAAERDAHRERRLADAMERDRLAGQRAMRPSGAGRLDRPLAAAAVGAKASAPARRQRHGAVVATGPEDFTAFDPSSKTTKSKSAAR